MLEIALNSEQQGIYQKDIAQNQKLSFKYLDQIISALKSAGLIENVKGKKSGYKLGRPPEKITMYDIHRACEGEICVVSCLCSKQKCPVEDRCAPRNFWAGLNKNIKDYLSTYTLEELTHEQIDINSLL